MNAQKEGQRNLSEQQKISLIRQLKEEIEELKQTEMDCIELNRELSEMENAYRIELNKKELKSSMRRQYDENSQKGKMTSTQLNASWLMSRIQSQKERIAITLYQNQLLQSQSSALNHQITTLCSTIEQTSKQNQKLNRKLQQIKEPEGSIDDQRSPGSACSLEHSSLNDLKNQQEEIASIELESALEKQQALQENIEYIKDHIKQIQRDIDHQRLVIEEFTDEISLFKSEKLKMRKSNQRLLEHYKSCKAIRDKRRNRIKQVEEDIWKIKQQACLSRLINHEIEADVNRTDDVIYILDQQNNELHIQLKGIHVENKNLCKMLGDQAYLHRKIRKFSEETQQSDLDKTVIRNSARPPKWDSPENF